MSKQIHIVSREIIKPSNPTPPHLQTFKFSLLNQTIRNEPTPVHLFYPSTTRDTAPTPPPGPLKRALATTLTRLYPLAGRIIDNSYIDCSDQGAVYYEARVDCSMSHFLDRQEGDLIDKLKLISPMASEPAVAEAILFVQVSMFSCGGIAICACISHKIADAAAFATFLNSWGAAARGAASEIRGCVLDSCHLFPPKDPSTLGKPAASDSDHGSLLATNRFVFAAHRISSLQEKLSIKGTNRPSRVQALAALIWGSFIRITQQENDSRKRIKHVASHTINLRSRTDPQLPGDCVNNVIESIMGIEWPGEKPVEFARIAVLMKEAISKYDDSEYVMRIHRDETYYDARREVVSGYLKGEVEWFKFSSNCRVAYYETDFGWGRPSWVVSAVVPVENYCVFMDGPPLSGGAIEAWVVLLKEDMEKLVTDSCFRSYADPSYRQIILSHL